MNIEFFDSILRVLPVLVVITLAIIQLLLGLSKEKSLKLPLLVLFVLFAVFFSFLGAGIPVKNGGAGLLFQADSLTWSLNFILLSAYFLSACLNNKQATDKSVVDSDVLMAFATSGAMLMVAAANLIVLFIGFEILSIAVYALSGVAKKEKASAEASLKYFILGCFASAFMLYGFALIYGATGNLDLAVIAKSDNTMLYLALGLIIFGFAFKIGLMPFHYWKPDVYQGAPITVVSFIAVVVQIAALAAFFKLLAISFIEFSAVWVPVIAGLAVLSMTVGNLLALRQDSLKRMLAYSSIAHAGYILMAFVALKNSAELLYSSITYYLLAYALMTIGAFAVLMLVTGAGAEQYKKDRLMTFDGLGWERPALGFAMTLFMLSLAGIPPLVGFVGKFYVFSEVIKTDLIWLVVAAAINSVISFCYYLRVVLVMYFKTEYGVKGKKRQTKDSLDNILATGYLKFVVTISAVCVIFFGVYAQGWTKLSELPNNLFSLKQSSKVKVDGANMSHSVELLH
ncbi:MAG: NADH-quinone oxidoreductase subunit N [Deltaproteobacteria bacterium]|jgi:NADH-quinone oxidoreductase subunit N|nr:NADH-quinone oxidoreductase subunit N [Deltaproteobacteria bacterium]